MYHHLPSKSLCLLATKLQLNKSTLNLNLSSFPPQEGCCRSSGFKNTIIKGSFLISQFLDIDPLPANNELPLRLAAIAGVSIRPSSYLVV